MSGTEKDYMLKKLLNTHAKTYIYGRLKFNFYYFQGSVLFNVQLNGNADKNKKPKQVFLVTKSEHFSF